MIDSCVGIDPGPLTGMCFLQYHEGRLVGRTLLQCDGGSAVHLLRYTLLGLDADAGHDTTIGRKAAAVEKFITGRSAGTTGKPAEVTRQLVMELAEVCEIYGYPVTIRPAADVKPKWTDKRLTAAGIATESEVKRTDFRHAYDSARHCLCGAREAGVIQDPLLRRSM